MRDHPSPALPRTFPISFLALPLFQEWKEIIYRAGQQGSIVPSSAFTKSYSLVIRAPRTLASSRAITLQT